MMEKAEMYDLYLKEKQKVIEFNTVERENHPREVVRPDPESQQKLVEAMVIIEKLNRDIKNLKMEQEVMAGVLHHISGEYCF